MVAVFAGFMTNADIVTKMIGVGLATAVALDATIVRLVLVPATMMLFGRANWWLPGWLHRLLPARPARAGVTVAGSDPTAGTPVGARPSP